jgi:hypothetical protein
MQSRSFRTGICEYGCRAGDTGPVYTNMAEKQQLQGSIYEYGRRALFSGHAYSEMVAELAYSDIGKMLQLNRHTRIRLQYCS